MNQYHIYDKIGRGKHSTVYKGRKKKTIQYYAIKSVDKSQKPRVLQEVRVMHSLDQPNILKFVAWYETANHLWLILEYCVGGDLISLLRQDMRLPESSIHDFGRDLVIALQYLHHNAIVYCDLKPSNVLLDENGRIKLGGFGLSRKLSDINKTPCTSLPSAKRGTPAYMAPELFNDGSTHSTASDLWALGCVLYECAAGRPPFMGSASTLNQMMHEILHKDITPIPSASPEFHHLLQRLLDKNPATRMKWGELLVHPFWQVPFPSLEMPAEPAFDAFIRKNNLLPVSRDVRDSMEQANERARSLRQSVNVNRFSRIALNNLEREGEGADYSAAQATQAGDIKIESADAELDFEETGDEGAEEDESASSTPADDGAVIDQGAASALPEGARVDVVGARQTTDNVRASQARLRAGDDHRPPSRGFDDDGSRPGTTGSPDRSLINQMADMSVGESWRQLMWHPSDLAVKPIIGNRRIEKLPEPKFEPKELGFRPWTLADMANADTREIEAFLTVIYRSIASAAPLKDKVNVLSYFETLCTDTNTANLLINSSLTVLFIRLLKNAKAPALRIRLASVLGLLVRHATFIQDDMGNTGVVEALAEALKDKNEKVRRRVMATLGELLFYIATQQQDAANADPPVDVAAAWGVTPATLIHVTRLLKPSEDEVTQHYAVKTIENISSQGGEWAGRFATQDVVYALVQIITAGKSEGLKSTAASTLSRLMRATSPLVGHVVDKFGVRLFLSGLSDSSSKVQLAGVNMLNLLLAQPDLSTRAKAQLADERGLAAAVVALLDHSLPLLRAKGVVSVLLLCRLAPRWLLELCRCRLMPALEKLARDKDDYVQAALEALRAEAAGLAPIICAQINEELGRPSGRKQPALASPKPSGQKNTLAQFQVVLHLVTTPLFRPVVVTPALIADLAAFFGSLSALSTKDGGSEFRDALLNVLEALCQQADIVVAHHQAILEQLLPAFCATIGAPSESGDTRFFCLRMVSDVVTLLVNEPDLYASASTRSSSGGSPGGGATGRLGATTAAVDAAVQSCVLPLIPGLLQDEDPMPLYALKLLGSLLEANPGYVGRMEAMSLAHQFFTFLSLDHANNNVHNIRLCRQIVAAGSLAPGQLLELGVVHKVTAVLAYAHQNNVEPFLEPVLDLCLAIINRDAGDARAGASDGAMLQQLLPQLPVFGHLCLHAEPPVAAAASACVLALVVLFPADTATWLCGREGAAVVTGALAGSQGVVPCQQAQHNLLAALSSVPADTRLGSSAEVAGLVETVRQLGASSQDAAVRQAATQALATLSSTAR